MVGPEHYVQAEMLLDSVGVRTAEDSYAAAFDARTAQVLAAAQVHATLALAAATAELDSSAPLGRFSNHARAWKTVLDGGEPS